MKGSYDLANKNKKRDKVFFQKYKKQNKQQSVYDKTFKFKGSNSKDIIKKLLNSRIGLYNAGGSCYMASIIQILIHSELFLEQFYKNKSYYSLYSLSSKFLNFIEKIANSVDSIEIKNFSNEYNKINNKFSGNKGNNPMTFFNEFIKNLSEETNENILKLYMGKRYIKFEGMSDLNYEEDFTFFLVVLDKRNDNIQDKLYEEKTFEDDENLKFTEEIIVKPNIFIINLEFDDYIDYKIEYWIKVDDISYNLKAINKYTDFHSIA